MPKRRSGSADCSGRADRNSSPTGRLRCRAKIRPPGQTGPNWHSLPRRGLGGVFRVREAMSRVVRGSGEVSCHALLVGGGAGRLCHLAGARRRAGAVCRGGSHSRHGRCAPVGRCLFCAGAAAGRGAQAQGQVPGARQEWKPQARLEPAGDLGRGRRRSVRRRPAGRLDRAWRPPRVRSRHRHQRWRADCAVRLSRPRLRPPACRPVHELRRRPDLPGQRPSRPSRRQRARRQFAAGQADRAATSMPASCAGWPRSGPRGASC